jgi:type II secretory pathway pseudopilin PulG
LAVIAVIMLLAALLLPVLGRAKARARAIHCINNGHQIALAAITYAADSDDWLPPNEIPLTDPSWVGQPNNGFYDTSTLLDPKHTLLAPYLRSLPIWKCAADTTQWYRSYSVNGAVGTKVVSLSPTDAPWLNYPGPNNSAVSGPWRTYGKLSHITTPGPSSLYFMVDVDRRWLSEPCFQLSMGTGPTGWGCFPGARHNFGSMLSYSDGHAEVHKFRDARTWGPAREDVSATFVAQGSPDNPDVIWMQQRTSAHR